MKKKLIDLFEYTYHFNKEMIIVITENIEKIDTKTISLLNHTLNAQQIWNSRILGENSFEVWQVNPLENLNEINQQNFNKSIEIIEKFDFDQKVQYENSKGAKFENTVFEILFQAINHSTYHRGQINSLLKQNEINPVLTDYIFYKR
ncbi:putative damage-inducible protein DinB [Chryseobacterium sp. SORGH_AS 447]|uniref:DinB family protein n=1 Tax=Chryseobacterium sp. SORGH_AS_0447 TaxID=3041769 RepID=UPI00278244DD|nr:DinB family protein [Chryseobacterium sp. SORGH_AS_0447]MDQ1161976.1 putative damage-inducible protein DinB [Chryseobacterium sp. SORGH_AS_0447]